MRAAVALLLFALVVLASANRVNLPEFGDEVSHAGYIQTNAEHNGNLFYWYDYKVFLSNFLSLIHLA